MKLTRPVILSIAKNLSRMRVLVLSRINLEILRRRLLRMTIIVSLFAFPAPAYAACTPGASGVDIGECFGFGEITSFGKITSDLVTPMFSVAAAVVTLYFLWGAFKFLIAGSNKEEVAGARQMITHAIVGFIILILAFFVFQFLLSSLFGITNYQIIK